MEKESTEQVIIELESKIEELKVSSASTPSSINITNITALKAQLDNLVEEHARLVKTITSLEQESQTVPISQAETAAASKLGSPTKGQAGEEKQKFTREIIQELKNTVGSYINKLVNVEKKGKIQQELLLNEVDSLYYVLNNSLYKYKVEDLSVYPILFYEFYPELRKEFRKLAKQVGLSITNKEYIESIIRNPFYWRNQHREITIKEILDRSKNTELLLEIFNLSRIDPGEIVALVDEYKYILDNPESDKPEQEYEEETPETSIASESEFDNPEERLREVEEEEEEEESEVPTESQVTKHRGRPKGSKNNPEKRKLFLSRFGNPKIKRQTRTGKGYDKYASSWDILNKYINRWIY